MIEEKRMIYKKIPIQIENSAADTALYLYLLDSSEKFQSGKCRPMIVICPGGAYAGTSDREAEPVAVRFMGMGYHVAVLRYSVAPVEFPTSLLELAETMKLLREHADEWKIESEKIFVLGFSAGGHLTASLGVFWNHTFLREKIQTNAENIKPAGLILCYPVISSGEKYGHERSIHNLLGSKYDEYKEFVSLEKQVSQYTPPCFIWQTFSDPEVSVENSILFAKALCDYKIPVELHIYPHGNHGLSLADETSSVSDGSQCCPEVQSWVRMLETWLKVQTKTKEKY